MNNPILWVILLAPFFFFALTLSFGLSAQKEAKISYRFSQYFPYELFQVVVQYVFICVQVKCADFCKKLVDLAFVYRARILLYIFSYQCIHYLAAWQCIVFSEELYCKLDHC
jgi:hypothetical protein